MRKQGFWAWVYMQFGLGVLLAMCCVTQTQQAQADNCRRVGVTNTYVAPYVANHYVAPTTYQHAYNYETLVPFVQKVVVNPDFYFSVGDEYRQLAFAKLVAAEYAKIAPQQQIVVQQAPPQATANPPKESVIVQPQVPPPVPPLPVVGTGAECKPVMTGLPDGFKKLVEAKCANCHSSGKAKAYLDLSSLDQLHNLPLATRDRMFRSVSNGRMPKGGKVADGELDLFNAFASLAEKALYGTPEKIEPAKK